MDQHPEHYPKHDIKLLIFNLVINFKYMIMKKISQYNWNWWFIVNLIGIFIGMMIAMTAETTDDLWLVDIVLIITFLSFIPCLYIGMKTEE